MAEVSQGEQFSCLKTVPVHKSGSAKRRAFEAGYSRAHNVSAVATIIWSGLDACEVCSPETKLTEVLLTHSHPGSSFLTSSALYVGHGAAKGA